jgi:hypothetical protein
VGTVTAADQLDDGSPITLAITIDRCGTRLHSGFWFVSITNHGCARRHLNNRCGTRVQFIFMSVTQHSCSRPHQV